MLYRLAAAEVFSSLDFHQYRSCSSDEVLDDESDSLRESFPARDQMTTSRHLSEGFMGQSELASGLPLNF